MFVLAAPGEPRLEGSVGPEGRKSLFPGPQIFQREMMWDPAWSILARFFFFRTMNVDDSSFLLMMLVRPPF